VECVPLNNANVKWASCNTHNTPKKETSISRQTKRNSWAVHLGFINISIIHFLIVCRRVLNSNSGIRISITYNLCGKDLLHFLPLHILDLPFELRFNYKWTHDVQGARVSGPKEVEKKEHDSSFPKGGTSRLPCSSNPEIYLASKIKNHCRRKFNMPWRVLSLSVVIGNVDTSDTPLSEALQISREDRNYFCVAAIRSSHFVSLKLLGDLILHSRMRGPSSFGGTSTFINLVEEQNKLKTNFLNFISTGSVRLLERVYA
jgi:hypothetical protein